MMTIEQLAAATYEAMLFQPQFVNIAERLLSTSGKEREQLVKKTPSAMMEQALVYLAAPALTRERERRLAWLRADPRRMSMIKVYYKDHIAQFIDDWGVTSDPRELAQGKSVLVPFRLWPKQFDMVDWMLTCFRKGQPGACCKGRDVGASWIMMAVFCSLAVFEKGFAAGVGSATEVKLDQSGNPDTLLWKAREFLKHLPTEFKAGYTEEKHSFYLRLVFPETGSSITAEAGTNIGRGGRKSIYGVDEAAFIENPMKVAASLAATTNCRLDVSTPQGVNAFFDHYHNPAVSQFHMDWRAQPLDALIMTSNGPVRMGDVRIGNKVLGSNGKSTEVIGIYPKGKKEVFRITFDDGSFTESCDDHLWEVIPLSNHRKERRHITKTMKLSEIRKEYRRIDKHGYNTYLYQIPLCEPVEFNSDCELPIDPYVLGCLLGDGDISQKNSVSIASADVGIINQISKRLSDDVIIHHTHDINYRIIAKSKKGIATKNGNSLNSVLSSIRKLGLSGKTSYDKYIPDNYKRGAKPSERLDLLRGLFDTDGHAPLSHKGAVKYSSVSERLARDVVFIVQSLGGTATLTEINKSCPVRIFPDGRKHKTSPNWLVTAKLPDGMIPFLLDRKASRMPITRQRPPRRSIINIESVSEKETQCIEVRNKNGLYLTDNFIVTHNCDPRKDQAWYDKKKAEMDPVVFAQEIDASFYASAEGVLVPPQWVSSAVGLLEKLKLEPSGIRVAGFDVADLGKDRCAWAARYGNQLVHAVSWTGMGGDIHASTAKAFILCDMYGINELVYDANGVGADVRGAARVLNEIRVAEGMQPIKVIEYVSSNTPIFPDRMVPGTNRKAKDLYLNRAAQTAHSIRKRFEAAYKSANGELDEDGLISINPAIPELSRLIAEFSQPCIKETASGKWQLEKTPKGAKSPNLYDATAMAFAPRRMPMVISPALLHSVSVPAN